MSKKMKVPRGTARRLRRADIVRFKSEQRAKRQVFTGTIKVNAPTLEMLNKFISKVQP